MGHQGAWIRVPSSTSHGDGWDMIMGMALVIVIVTYEMNGPFSSSPIAATGLCGHG